ncbi:MAG TPA: ATP-binding protein [Vicinamibacterales bacterium]|nr:ATP-binding protein [Vicinamibacterales bacterium]
MNFPVNQSVGHSALAALFNSAPIGIAFFDASLRHLQVNSAYARMTAHAVEKHIGVRPDEVLGPAASQMISGLTNTLATGQATEVWLHVHESGGPRHCVGVCCRLEAADGTPSLGLMMRDITDRTRAEEERIGALQTEQQLRQDAERQRDFIRLVLENAPISIGVCEGPDFRLMLINDFAVRIIGGTRDAIIGRPIAETFPQAFAMVRELYERVFYNGETIVVPESRIPLPDGRQIWSSACYAPVRSADGTAIGVMSLGLDVTALKQTQLVLESQKNILEMIARDALLAEVLEAVVDAVAEHSVRGIRPAIMLADAAARQLRHAAGPKLPAGFRAAVDLLPVAANAASCGTAAFIRQRVVTTDVMSDPVWAGYRAAAAKHGIRACCSTPIVGSAGNVLGTLAMYATSPGVPSDEELRVADLMVRLITVALERQSREDERGRLLAAERQAREQADRANRTKDEFVATLSHELWTPLNAILGWARMLRAGQLDEAATIQALDAIERNTRAQSQLVEDLLDISRIITGKLRLDVRSVELSSVVDTAVDAVKPAADAKNIRLQKVLDPRAAPISADPDRLQQVVWNLLSNAIKFTPKHGRVQVRLERINSHVEIIVSDTGEGITPELLPHVFERFSQGAEDGAKTAGLGLGLAIARHIVELHGGTIHAASAGRGAGATFTVKLPLMVAHGERSESEVHPTATTGVLPATLPRLDGVRVLVVEDDADGREIVRRILEQAGGEVRTAENPTDADAVLAEWRPQLLISDIEMPGEDGYAFLRRLRQSPTNSARELPAIALTAYARVEDRIRALAAGFQMHVPKPVEPAELIAVILALVPNAGPPS